MNYCGLGKKATIAFILFLALLFVSNPVLAGTVGKIAGTVIDKNTNEPLPGVNIVIEGTTMGAATDADGRYYIINVPIGDYTVTASIIGYQKVVVENVHVSVDITTDMDFEMTETVIEGDVMTITAERPLVQRDQTATVRITTSEEIENMPVRDYQEVVGQSAGVVQFQDGGGARQQGRGGQATNASNLPQLNVRGGRANQVAYIVDGFSVQDPISGNTTATIVPDAIDEIVIMTGGFNAEYGRIMSGAVNVSTKRGQKDYSGKISATTDNIKVDAEPQDYNVYDISFSGPLIPGNEKINFFLSGSRAWNRNREPRGNVPADYFDMIADVDSVMLGGHYEPTINNFDRYENDFENFRNGVLPGNTKDSWAWQGKVGIDLSENLKIDISTLGSRDAFQAYTHSYLFNSEHMNYIEDENTAFNAKVTYTMNKNTFFTVAGNYFETERFSGDGLHRRDLLAYGRPGSNPNNDETELFLSWDDMNGFTETVYDTISWSPSAYDNAASLDPVVFIGGGDEGHVLDDYFLRNSSYVGFDFDITSQVHTAHEVKAGFDMQKHKMRYFRHLFPTRAHRYLNNPEFANQDVDSYGYSFDPITNEVVEDDDPNGDGLDGPKEPTTMSFYLQDKFDYEGIIVNVGLRYDYLDVNTERLTDENHPLAAGASASGLDPEDLQDAEAHTAFSPRLGIGFPVTDKTAFHASYGTFYQQPNLFDLYVSYAYMEYMVRDNPYFYPFGNPNLDWEKTTAYEVGLRHQLNDISVLEVTSYYKSISDLVQVRSVSEGFSTYKNDDYGTVKGFDFAYRTMRSNNLAFNLSYSLSWATGTGSTANSTRNIAWHEEEPPKTSQPLDYDQRHKFTFNVDYRYGSNAPMSFLNNFGVNLLGSFTSGTPYTPSQPYNEITLASTTSVTDGAINSRYSEWVFRMDMKANKSVKMGGLNMNFFVWVLNLLDRENAIDVYESSGDPQSTSWLATDAGYAFINDPGTVEAHDTSGLTAEQKYLLKEQDPSNYDLPRTIRFGVEVGF